MVVTSANEERNGCGPLTEIDDSVCPVCGEDDYECEEWQNGEPDYDGPKTCQNCGEKWV